MNNFHLPEISATNQDERNGSFAIEPLHRGFGVTIGNSLRRVLLSSLGGAAVTAFSVKGAAHEFTTVEGVKEDLVTVTLNLKKLHFKVYADEPQVLKIKKKGKGVVTAADIESNSDVEVVNTDQVIATVDDDKTTFEMELRVEKGRGYSSVDERSDELPVEMIGIDASFSPVERVRYKTENTRVGQITDLDKLILDIETDGTIAPEDALNQAAAILVNHFNIIAGGSELVASKEEDTEETETEDLAISIADMELSQRTLNALEKNEITTVKQLASMSESELKDLKGFGSKALEEVVAKLKELELK